MISKNAVALVILALGMIGINVETDQVVEILSAIATIISFLTLIWNQLDRPDVKLFFWKKK